MSDKCGTYAGWNAHNFRHEPQCDPCKMAQRDYQRARRKAGRDKWTNARIGTCVRGLGWPRIDPSADNKYSVKLESDSE